MKRCAAQQGQVVADRKKKKKKSAFLTDPSLQYIDVPTKTPIVDEARSFFKSIAVPFEVHCGPVTGWRSVAKLAVRGCKESGIITKNCIGLFAPKSHDIIPCLHSVVHHHSINFVVRLLEDVLIEKSITGYREETDKGLLRYLLFAVELSSEKVQITFVLNCNVGDEASLEAIKSVCDSFLIGKKKKKRIHSFWVHFNPASKHNNAITGRQDNSWLCIHGDDMLREAIYLDDDLELSSRSYPSSKPQLCFPPNVFRQANLLGFSKIIQTIRRWIPKRSKVIELYAGVGTIGLQILDLVKRIQCSDENPYNKACFERTLSDYVDAVGNDKYLRRAAYMSSPAKDRALSGQFDDFDLLLVDPPRKGLDQEVIDALIHSSNIKRLVYVSCGFKAFRENANQLLDSGSWDLIFAEGHVLFPGADHIETLAIFNKC